MTKRAPARLRFGSGPAILAVGLLSPLRRIPTIFLPETYAQGVLLMLALEPQNFFLLGFMGIGAQELIIIAIIVLILFGSRLPSVMRNLGRGVTEFKKGVQGVDEEEEPAAKKEEA